MKKSLWVIWVGILILGVINIKWHMAYSELAEHNKRNTNVDLIESLYTTIENQKREIRNYKKENTYVVEITAYTARKEECNEDFMNTALMEKPIVGFTIAVSQDLHHLLGSKVYIKGLGVRRINDLMNERYKNRIDILVPTVKHARDFGLKKGIMVIINE